MRHVALSATVILLSATASQAQVCKEVGSTAAAPTGHSYINCDQTYRNTTVNCDDKIPAVDSANNIQHNADGTVKYQTVGTRPSCPSKAMPMIRTPAKSLVSDYSPSLYTYLRDKTDPNLPYNGTFAVGTSEGPDRVFGMFGAPAKDTTRIAGCVQQITFQNKQPQYGTKDEAQQVRLQLDNCANQYILNWSIYPYQKSNAKLIDATNQYITPDSECQLLKTFNEDENEYSAAEYLKLAWIKTLQDPSKRKSFSVFKLPNIVGDILKAAGFGLPNVLVAGQEPHLPDGVKIVNPIAPPDPFPEVSLSSIGAAQQEEIIDPTHPYSPRWDFGWTDRDYSELVKTANYMTDDAEKDSVYCAGIHKSTQSDAQKKADEEVRVDVLSFRQKAFTAGITNRIAYNYMCKREKNGDWTSITEYDPTKNPILSSHCYQYNLWTLAEFAVRCWFGDCDPSIIEAKKIACWQCFGLKNKNKSDDDKVADEKYHPPCSTHWGGQDLSMKPFNCGISPCVPGALNGGFPVPFGHMKASCSVDNPIAFPPFNRQSKYDIDTLCNNLRKPFTPLNKLKMRYFDPSDKDNTGLQAGVPEGYLFKQYFGNHMPYPRLWDTGLSLHKTVVTDRNYQNPQDVTGQYTAIVGIGREGAAPSAGKDAVKAHPDERCMLGGWGGPNLFGVSADDIVKNYGINKDGTVPTTDYLVTHPPVSFTGASGISLPDPVTSWTEMKLYQARVERNVNISCIGRYEKVFKPGSSENVALSSLGGEWSHLILQKTPKDLNAVNRSSTNIKLDEFLQITSASSYNKTAQTKKEGWPLSWRGYMAEGTGTLAYDAANLGSVSPAGRNIAMAAIAGANQFPQFGSLPGQDAASIITGLDHSQLGDIVMMPRGGAPDGAHKPGLAKVSFVAEVASSCATSDKTDCYVKLLDADNGKWPDACGTTDTWSQQKSRYVYPPGKLPSPAKQDYLLNSNGTSGSCEDTKLGTCELSSFYTVPIYRPTSSLSVRAGCEKDHAGDCK